MKRKLLFLTAVVAMLFASCGDDQYSNIHDYVSKETIYPGKYDFAKAKIGIEAVEIDLLEAGRIPHSEVKLGKAVRTVVEYDNEVIEYPDLRSWVRIEGLTRPKMYNFRIYTMDDFGNKSVPVELDEPVMPYFPSDIANLVMPDPRIIFSRFGVTMIWPPSLIDKMMLHNGSEFEYIDPTGEHHEGSVGAYGQVLVKNSFPGDLVTIDLAHSVIPVINGAPIADVVTLKQRVDLLVPRFIPWVNVAENARVLADSEIGGNIAKNAVNDDPDEYWMSADNNDDHWIEIDLGAGFPIQGFEIVTEEGNPLKNFDFQIFGGKTSTGGHWLGDRWISIVRETSNTEHEYFALIDKITAARVRLYTYGQPVKISQIAVYVVESDPMFKANVAHHRHCWVSDYAMESRLPGGSGYSMIDGGFSVTNLELKTRWYHGTSGNYQFEIYFERPVTITGYKTWVQDTDNMTNYVMKVCDDPDPDRDEQHSFPYAFPHGSNRGNPTLPYKFTDFGTNGAKVPDPLNLTYQYVPYPRPDNVNWVDIFNSGRPGIDFNQRIVEITLPEPVTTSRLRWEIFGRSLRLSQMEIYSTIQLY